MEGFDPATSFAGEESKRYDADSVRGDEEHTVAFLAHLADGREALELAVGTGRLALHRWGGWNGEPFDATSWRHISVYARAIGRDD